MSKLRAFCFRYFEDGPSLSLDQQLCGSLEPQILFFFHRLSFHWRSLCLIQRNCLLPNLMELHQSEKISDAFSIFVTFVL